MNKINNAIDCIIHAHHYVQQYEKAFLDHDISAYIADYARTFYTHQDHNASLEDLAIEEYIIEEHASTPVVSSNEWLIGTLMPHSVIYLSIIKLDQDLYYRYRECKAYQKACNRDLTREEIEQFLCNDSSYTNRTLKEHPEYNYPAFVYAYQYKDTYQYGAMFPGYPGISGSGKDPQTALEDAYQRLSTFM